MRIPFVVLVVPLAVVANAGGIARPQPVTVSVLQDVICRPPSTEQTPAT